MAAESAVRKLILVRHSLPEVQPGVPAERWRLSDEGRRRCRPLADALRPHEPSLIATSPAPRATETGERVSALLGCPISLVDGLDEHRRPDFTPEDSFESQLAALFAEPDRLVMGDETGRAALERFTGTLDGVVASTTGTVAVVSHRTVIVLFVSTRCGLEPMDLWWQLEAPSYVVLSLPSYDLEEVRAGMGI